MKKCPNCGKSFSWWKVAVGEYKDHLRSCKESGNKSKDEAAMANSCRGCPAGCFEGEQHPKEQ